MSDYVIIPDSSCDLNKELRERFDIPDITRGVLYYPDGHSELADVDWETMTPKEFYDSMKGRNVLYKTACPPGEEIIEKYEKHLKAGRDIIAPVLSTALSATYNDCSQVAKELLKKFPSKMIYDAINFDKYLSVIPEAATAVKSGVSAMHDVTEGGIFGGLWEMAESSGVGLLIDLRKIPVKQETIEICNYFDINPYELISSGSMLMASKDGNKLKLELERIGIEATIIGKCTDNNDRVLINGENKRFLEPPKTDELYKVICE